MSERLPPSLPPARDGVPSRRPSDVTHLPPRARGDDAEHSHRLSATATPATDAAGRRRSSAAAAAAYAADLADARWCVPLGAGLLTLCAVALSAQAPTPATVVAGLGRSIVVIVI